MGGLAFLFPGQASQEVGMGMALGDSLPEAGALLRRADEVTGLPLVEVMRDGPLERLTRTEFAQPAVVATSLAALLLVRRDLGEAATPAATAGHSVGELAACVAAGALDDATALALVRERAQAMAAACAQQDGTMAAVLGLDEAAVQAVCAEASTEADSVQVANLNAPGQVVISGTRVAVDRAAEAARARGARRVLPLAVGGPFHSRYMAPAVERFSLALDRAPLAAARVPVVGNVAAEPLTDAPALREELARQVAAPVRWTDVLERLAALGCDRFLELGPGQVLAGLVRRTLPGARVASVGAPADLDAARALIA